MRKNIAINKDCSRVEESKTSGLQYASICMYFWAGAGLFTVLNGVDGPDIVGLILGFILSQLTDMVTLQSQTENVLNALNQKEIVALTRVTFEEKKQPFLSYWKNNPSDKEETPLLTISTASSRDLIGVVAYFTLTVT